MSKKNLVFKKTLVARALTVAFGVGAATVGFVPEVMAQSTAAGIIYGQVDNASGASIVILNTETGAKRTVSIDASGRYQATALPIGHYKVQLVRNGNVDRTDETDVIAGQGVNVSFAAAAQTVQVTATRTRIDVSNTNNGAVFTAKELARMPVKSDISSVALLAPNTTRGDSAYGNATSFGGGGVSENSFYINGFPVTNPLTQLGSSQLPFGAISQVSVITGGFGSEFGRSIGGVMNVITKSGTNNWEAGATYSVTPNALRATPLDIYYDKTGNPDNASTDGKLYRKLSVSTFDEQQYGAYVSGPLIKDKLMMFLAADRIVSDYERPNTTDSTTLSRDGWYNTRSDNLRYLAKFDWNVTDDHRLELTSLGDNTKERIQRFGFDEATSTPNNVLYNQIDQKNAGSTGSSSNALKYIGQLTDNLTLTTLYGVLKAKRDISYLDYDVNAPLLSITSSPSTRVPALDQQGLYKNYQKYSGNITKPGEDTVKSFRFDLEYKLGNHTIRGGLDKNELEALNAGVFRAGGGNWAYKKVPTGKEFSPVPLSNSRLGIVGNFGGYGTQGYYVQKFEFSSITSAKSSQAAQYIEDRWQATKDLLIIGGLRNDQYSNSNGDGEKFIDMKNQLAPRLAASWNVNGDSSMKVFGSLGRYYLQLPTQVAARAASRSTYLRQDFTYTGIDSKGQPTGLNPINTPASPDGEFNQPKDPRSVASKNLKPNFQDEITLGFERTMSPSLNVGAKLTYRKLGAGIDDNCDMRGVAAYSKKVGLPQAEALGYYGPCFIFNPGEDATIWVDGHDANGAVLPGQGRWVTFTAKEMGFPKVERTYTAIDLFAEHPFRNHWYGKVNYTWSRSKGNMEGQTNSDTGQTDVGTTALWDFPEFMTFANGLLPNDRTHQIKAFGFYELTSEWSVGANLLLQSGRPKSCIGTDLDAEQGLKSPWGDTYGGSGYGNSYFGWCDGKAVPRGSLGRMPWEKRLDLSLTYKPQFAKGLVVGLDVYNVTNNQVQLTREEEFDGGDGALQASYNRVRAYAAPRSAKLRIEYHHKF